jgi:hypothetical protein
MQLSLSWGVLFVERPGLSCNTSQPLYIYIYIYIYIYQFWVFLNFLILFCVFYVQTVHVNTGRDSSVGIALGYGMDDWGCKVRLPVGAGNFLFTTASRTALGPTQPPIQWVQWALSLGVKRPGREADHSPPSSAEVKECVELYLHSPQYSSWRGA